MQLAGQVRVRERKKESREEAAAAIKQVKQVYNVFMNNNFAGLISKTPSFFLSLSLSPRSPDFFFSIYPTNYYNVIYDHQKSINQTALYGGENETKRAKKQVSSPTRSIKK